ncbi:hypothetical protein B0T17DRAFT_345570 [Bombardia bombarda]|uniref:DUF7892 domain-containing protein n=1 Tax=Bombardia bombarda TaxID=252184 RepID=A0AA39WNC9_9PEZI|nr:hypothetical protein B0T17DRAFT_345570 [Bombardia bombarda]
MGEDDEAVGVGVELDEVGRVDQTPNRPVAEHAKHNARDSVSGTPMGLEMDTAMDTEEDGNRASTTAVAPRRGAATEQDLPAPSRKRKSPGHSLEPHPIDASWPGEGPKKVKLAGGQEHQPAPSWVTDSSLGRDKSLLSAELWHHIFTFCPPKLLGNLLRVNKLFNLYLDPSSSVRKEFPISVTGGALALLKPNAIWQASRRLFWPYMPAPLRSKTELAMWQLACSRRCQNCDKIGALDLSGPPSSWRSGPGSEWVAIIWPFASRMCGSCLLQKSVKEIDLLLSPSIPAAIVPALPFVFLTQELHLISTGTIEQGQLPANVQITKLFSSSDVDAMEKEFLAVRDMGPGTVDEWLKGLDSRGNNLRHEASKWEKWESSGGAAKMLTQLYPGHIKQASVVPVEVHIASANTSSSAPAANPPSAQSLPQARHGRTMEEVAELKASRKIEIERRALLLDPPLPADVLRHIPSFQAATHIITPLDDNAWELLKPRLLAQRADAEQRERESEAQNAIKQDRDDRRHLETTLATTKEARDLIDKDWEEVQAPVRAKIASYADDIIRDNWEKGKKVTKDNCSKFAAEVLITTRKRFYADVAKDAAAAKAAGQTPPVDPLKGPFTQKLTLENMKWIFDTKIKPYTESHCKELFYCNGCEGNYKTFGFEGVIQHYAAKHTNSLSVGSVVVHWRAEWPELPPFSPEARAVKPPFYGPVPTTFAINTSLPRNPYDYHVPPGPPGPPAYPPQPPPSYGLTPYSDHFHHPPPPQPYQPQTTYPPFAPQTSYAPAQPYVAQPGPYQQPPYQPPAGLYHPPPPTAGVESAQIYGPQQGSNYNYNYGPCPANTQAHYTAPPPLTYPDTYQTKLEDVAHHSREVWHSLSNVKDLPGSMRVFVTIHHLVKRYRFRFGETPPLSIFIDGLSNNKDMRPVRNVNGLVCKTCHYGLGNAASVEQERKSFSLPQLANHFQSKHVEPMQNSHSPPDWAVDMVLLPDLSLVAGLGSTLNDNQRSLIVDAIPDAFQLQTTAPAESPYQDQQDHSRAYPAVMGDNHNGFYGAPLLPQTNTRNSSAKEDGSSHDYRSSRQPAGAYGSRGYPDLSQSQRPSLPADASQDHASFPATAVAHDRAMVSAISVTNSEHDRVMNSEGGRHSSQSSRPVREQTTSQTHRKRGVKHKRGKLQSGGENGRRASKEESMEDEKEVRREEDDIRAVWAAERAEAARLYSLSKAEQKEKTDRAHIPEAQQPSIITTQHPQRPLRHKAIAQPAPLKEEPNLMAALEMHLDQGRPPANLKQQQMLSNIIVADDSSSVLPANARYAARSYARHSDGGDRSRSPTYGARYYQPELPPRDGSPAARQLEPVYYSRPVPVERHETGYDRYGVRAEVPEQMPRRVDDKRYDWPLPRLEDHGHGHDGALAALRPEYYQYAEEARRPPRPPVEALYEIVHVIDESGEYYIQRPVRRGPPQSRYVYGVDRTTHGDMDHYGAGESAYIPVSRAGPGPGPPPHGPVEFGAAVEHRRTSHRNEAVHQEEYDPRFPGV